MYYSRQQALAAQQARAEENQANAKASAILLRKVASLVVRPEFAKFMDDYSGRFDWATPALHSRLTTSVLVDMRYTAAVRGEVDSGELYTRYADKLIEEAEKLEQRFNVKLRQADSRWTKKQGASMVEQIIDLLEARHAVRAFMLEHYVSAYARESLQSLAWFAQARLTLLESTGHSLFENVLANVTERYMLDGYPADLLTGDANSARNGRPLITLALRKTHCSTVWVEKESDFYAVSLISSSEWELHEHKRPNLKLAS